MSVRLVVKTRNQKYIGAFLSLLSMFFVWVQIPEQVFAVQIAEILATLLYFTFIIIHVFNFLLKNREVDIEIILAAIAGYVYLGIVGGILCHLVEFLTPGAFGIEEVPQFYTFIYFSFVTLTTLGYGDISPQIPVAQSISIIISVLGQLYLTIIIAMLIGKFFSKPR